MVQEGESRFGLHLTTGSWFLGNTKVYVQTQYRPFESSRANVHGILICKFWIDNLLLLEILKVFIKLYIFCFTGILHVR